MSVTATRRAPTELVDHDQLIRWVRADLVSTAGRARAFFASDWGVPFTAVRVRKTYLRAVGLRCECGAPATGGMRFHWKHGGHSVFLCCKPCLRREQADVVCTAAAVEAVDLQEAAAAQQDAPLEQCRDTDPGAVGYWYGSES